MLKSEVGAWYKILRKDNLFQNGTSSKWLTLDQISSVFSKGKSNIYRHEKNIFTAEEQDKKAVVAKNATVQKEGKRIVERQIEYYNLDLV